MNNGYDHPLSPRQVLAVNVDYPPQYQGTYPKQQQLTANFNASQLLAARYGAPISPEEQAQAFPAVTKPTGSRFKALDTLRGFAALCVTYYHLSFAVEPTCHHPLHLCVDFFLVLSGFVLAHTYTYTTKSITPVQFIGHRWARLWPLAAYTSVVTFLIRLLLINQMYYTPFEEGLQLFTELLLLNGLGLLRKENVNNPPSWTVSLEFWLNVPFAFVITKDTPPFLIFLSGSICQCMLYYQAGSLATTGGYFGILRCSSSFMFGIGTYMMHVRLVKNWDCEGFSHLVVTSLEAVLCFILFCIFNQENMYASTTDFVAPWIFCLIVMIFAREQGLISQALGCLEILGTISYSIYLNHRGLLALLFPGGPNPHIAGLMVWTQPRALILLWGLLLPYSYLTYRCVEMPSLRLLRGIVDDAVQNQIGFDGQWMHRGEIYGSEFTALNGTIGSLVKTGPKSLVLSYEGEVHTGELWDDGHLHWADGDVWIRCRSDRVAVVSL